MSIREPGSFNSFFAKDRSIDTQGRDWRHEQELKNESAWRASRLLENVNNVIAWHEHIDGEALDQEVKDLIKRDLFDETWENTDVQSILKRFANPRSTGSSEEGYENALEDIVREQYPRILERHNKKI